MVYVRSGLSVTPAELHLQRLGRVIAGQRGGGLFLPFGASAACSNWEWQLTLWLRSLQNGIGSSEI